MSSSVSEILELSLETKELLIDSSSIVVRYLISLRANEAILVVKEDGLLDSPGLPKPEV